MLFPGSFSCKNISIKKLVAIRNSKTRPLTEIQPHNSRESNEFEKDNLDARWVNSQIWEFSIQGKSHKAYNYLSNKALVSFNKVDDEIKYRTSQLNLSHGWDTGRTLCPLLGSCLDASWQRPSPGCWLHWKLESCFVSTDQTEKTIVTHNLLITTLEIYILCNNKQNGMCKVAKNTLMAAH